MLATFLYGLSTGFSLILAIGAQNAFVLKQGIKQQYVFVVCCICALSDAMLICMGVFGFAKIIEQYPQVISIAKYFGAAFLFIYGAKSFYSAIKHTQSLTPEGESKSSLAQVVAVCLAFTWLNPHVYLDTVVLLGSISAQFDDYKIFALGAMLASVIFFFSLGYGAKLLTPWFAKPIAWKVLDVLVGVVMWAIAASLLLNS